MPWAAVYFFHYELRSEDCYPGPTLSGQLLTCFAPEHCVVGKETKQLLGGKRLNGLGFFFLPPSLPSFLLSFTRQMLLKFTMSGCWPPVGVTGEEKASFSWRRLLSFPQILKPSLCG